MIWEYSISSVLVFGVYAVAVSNVIKVVGVCGSGKSTLVERLRARGFDARQISQEHSGVPDLWRRRGPPATLVYLEVSDEMARRRYPHLDLHDAYLAQERQRLALARQHAHCFVHTDELTPEEVLAQVLTCLGGTEPPGSGPGAEKSSDI